MVFVSVRENNAAHLVLILREIGNVGYDGIHARHFFVGKADPRVDNDDVVAVFKRGHILPDFAHAAKEKDFYVLFLLRRSSLRGRLCGERNGNKILIGILRSRDTFFRGVHARRYADRRRCFLRRYGQFFTRSLSFLAGGRLSVRTALRRRFRRFRRGFRCARSAGLFNRLVYKGQIKSRAHRVAFFTSAFFLWRALSAEGTVLSFFFHLSNYAP